ncbi:MAG: Membrane dipeptidase (Peptidase family M19) [Firmicutes bacterium ADurb.Bin193]|nr:MAG: Membrane dipeptidase (Peptidase family M19) [Firmicutes bacterium ADurb.Bin193]
MFSDAHCDTISRILDKKQELYENDGHVDAIRLKASGSLVQFYAAWIDPSYYSEGRLIRCLEIIDKFYTETEKCNIPVIKTAEDVTGGGALLSIEGGEALCGRISVLRMLYRLGVRAITLTWNGRNELAEGVGEGDTASGLSSFGRRAVCEMNALGMIVDVSHLAPKGFWDVAECSTLPFIASHSNAKAICPHRRNLTDEQITEIIRRKGFIGINFCASFLSEGGANITDIIRHIEHIMSLGGGGVLGFGADFDGVDDLPEGINGVEDMPKVINELGRLNYSQSQINAILYGNLHRAVKLILKK